VCYDTRIRKEYVQVYINGIALLCLIRTLHERLRPSVSQNISFLVPYLRGFFAAEGSVVLRPETGSLFHVDFSHTRENGIVDFIRSGLIKLGVKPGKYTDHDKKFQVYGRKNFEILKKHDICGLHPQKRKRFEEGFSKISRKVEDPAEVKIKILRLLLQGPLGYTQISKKLQKGRSTIQSYYIPRLEKNGLVKRFGKRRQAWLFGITKKGKEWLKDQTLL
ncbi:MAG TPA: transcriptional regulator, partial [Candidatus Aenigmarchaeota archaeon]|nr:transcriptional regulator [Candidatus Aenigmarchaeota archaeon]